MGPPEKPVLCNACGSRWRLRGNLNDYVPKHAISRNSTSGKHQNTLPYEAKHPARGINSYQKLKPEASYLSSTSPKEGKFAASSSGSSVPFPEKGMLAHGAEGSLVRGAPQQPAWNAESVTRKKRSNLNKQPSLSTNTLYHQLHRIQCDAEDENAFDHEEQEEGTLIYQKWQCIADNEIGFGAIPLNPPNVP